MIYALSSARQQRQNHELASASKAGQHLHMAPYIVPARFRMAQYRRFASFFISTSSFSFFLALATALLQRFVVVAVVALFVTVFTAGFFFSIFAFSAAFITVMA